MRSIGDQKIYSSVQPVSRANSAVIWLTGLSSAGKTTIGLALLQEIRKMGLPVEFLDGDKLRKILSPELGFSRRERELHARRVAYMSYLLSKNGVLTIVALISPFKESRNYARKLIATFIEVWVKCSLQTCKMRDPKGLYRKAKLGEINQMTGIQSPYEPPSNAELVLDTERLHVDQCCSLVMEYLARIGLIH